MKTDPIKTIRAITLLVLLLFVFILAACAREQPKQTKEVSIAWSEIEQSVVLEVGDVLEIVLPANPSTGYAWEAGFYNQSVLKPHGEPEFSADSPKLGAGGSQTLHFEAIDEGETDLILLDKRSFEEEEDPQAFQVHVDVMK